MRYTVIIERARNNASAYVPELPGCIATAASTDAVEREIRSAIDFHIDGLRKDGMAVPEMVEVSTISGSNYPGET